MPLRPVMPPPGCKRGATPDVISNAWWDMNWVRFRSGQLIPIGGWVTLNGTYVDSPPRDIITWHANLTGRWAAIGTDNRLYAFRFDTETLYDITPAGVGPLDPPGAILGWGIGNFGAETYGTARDPSNVVPSDASGTMGDWWSLALFGQDLLVVPTQHGGLFRWSPDTPSTPAALVAGAPGQNRGVLVTDERHVVLIGAGGNMRNVAWCSQEDPNTWAPGPSNTAGDLLLETEGRPLLARRVVGGNLIWTDNDVHQLTYAGQPYVYGLHKIAANCGLISPRAPSFCGAQVVWPSVQGFFGYEGGSVNPVQCDVGDWFFSMINRSMIGRIYGYGNAEYREHWWHFPDEGSTECNRYVAVNYADRGNPWIIGQLDCTAGDTMGAMIRPICGMGMPGGGGALRLHEFGWTDDGTSRVGMIYAETANLDIGEGDERFGVTQIEHDYAGPYQQVAYRFFCRERAGDIEYQAGPYPIIRTDGLVDTRFSARRARMRIEAIQDGPWALGVTRLNLVPGGKR